MIIVHQYLFIFKLHKIIVSRVIVGSIVMSHKLLPHIIIDF